jgi:hypothetical protein
MRLPRVLLAAVIGAILVPFLVAEDSPKIVVYLDWDSLQHSRLTISADGVRVAEVKPGRFFVMNAHPGPHVLIAGEGVPIVVDARANEKTFVRGARHIEFGPSGKVDTPVLEIMSPEQGELDLRFLVYVSPKQIFSSAVSKEDPFLQQTPKLKTRKSSF